MRFIDALKLRSKLFFLFMLITLGLIFVGIVGTSYINAMKKNMDSLYFGSLVPVTELNEIIQTYHHGISDPIHKASRGELNKSETSEIINKSLIQIENSWQSYSSHYKRDDEVAYVEYVGMEISAANKAFKKLLSFLKSGGEPHQISLNKVEEKVYNLHGVIKKLISYESEVAEFERKRFLTKYEDITYNIGLTLVVVIIALLLISMYVFKSIQHDHTKLHLFTKKLKVANKKLENRSLTDPLTGLYNRRYFNHIYEREIKRAKRNRTYITFMMLDIDFFKQYNDTYGHIEGDKALKSVTSVLNKTLKRPSDYLFRLGGEEFGILLSDTNETESANLARKLCKAVRDCKIEHKVSEVEEYVTISIGLVCCIADAALDNEILITRADEMLYEVKNDGRNGYQITTDLSSATTISA